MISSLYLLYSHYVSSAIKNSTDTEHTELEIMNERPKVTGSSFDPSGVKGAGFDGFR